MKINLHFIAEKHVQFTDENGKQMDFYRYFCKSADKGDTEIYLVKADKPIPCGGEKPLALEIASSKSKFPMVTELSGKIV